ncbi:MAG: riboflavin synthase [Rhodospirillaceae bacterium]
MFTGIITDIGSVRAIEPRDDGRIEIATGFDTGDVAIGASVACSGCCLTVIEKGAGWLAFAASGETRRLTTVGDWAEGTRVNLERALKAGDELGGHIVSGHVDGVGRLTGVEPAADSLVLMFDAGPDLARFIAAKGSVTVDGVSLTVNAVDGIVFSVNIIPHTQTATTLGALKPGQWVNLEIDMLARYVARLLEQGIRTS